jgi:hypothetical protein
MSPSCLFCYFLLELQVHLARSTILPLCEHFCSVCGGWLTLKHGYGLRQSSGMYHAWVTQGLGWEFEHSETDLGHWLDETRRGRG